MKHRSFVIFILLGLVPMAFAFQWRDLWETKDQQGQKLLKQGQFKEAETRFERPDWKAVSAYRAQDYSEAEAVFKSLQSDEAYYNLGNALAKQRKYQEAIQAYTKALTLNPKHQDALFNRKLIEDLLKKNQQQQQKQDSSNASQQDKQEHQEQKTENQKEQGEQNKEQNPSTQSPEGQKAERQENPSKNNHKESQDEQNQQANPSSSSENTQNNLNTSPKSTKAQPSTSEEGRASPKQEAPNKEQNEPWLRLIPDDPGGLLREKFLRDHLKRQNG